MDSYSKTCAGLGAICVGLHSGWLLERRATCSGQLRRLPPIPPPPADLSIPCTGVLPESSTSSSDGSAYIGSVGKGEIYKVAPGTTQAQPFIAPATGGIKQVFGVFADDSSGTLWFAAMNVRRSAGRRTTCIQRAARIWI